MSNAVSSEALKWLESLSAQIAHLSAYRQLVEPQLASEFNVLRYARTDEMGLSQILADLLNPKGPHGQGDVFLKCFLVRYWLDQATIGPLVNVRTEARTDRIEQSQRRIDILVDLGDCVLGIENKPWAADQPKQIEHYLKQLELSKPSKGGNPCFKLLYLTGHEGRPPSADSAGSSFQRNLGDGTLRLTSYKELQEWLRDCLRCCQNERVAMFLRDLDRHVEFSFSHGGVNFESTLIVKTAMASASGVSAAVLLNAPVAWDMRLLLLEQLEKQLQSEFSADKISGWSLDIPKSLNSQHATIEVACHANSALKFAFAFEKANCGDCFFGVGRRSSEDKSYDEALNKLLDDEFGVGQVSEWWGWSRSFEQRYWWHDRRIWVGIVDGSLATTIVKRLVEMIRVVEGSSPRNLFEQTSSGSVAPPESRSAVKAADVAREIYGRQNNAQLIEHLFAVEAANGPLRRALAERVVSSLRTKVEAISGFGEWISPEQRKEPDLTQINSGIGFRLRSRPALEVHVQFQAWSCRNAIFGLRRKPLDGRSDAPADLRLRLIAAGLKGGNDLAGWIWCQKLKTPNWFDQPKEAVSGYEGRIAEQTAGQIAELLNAVERAGLLGDQVTQPGVVES